jgi:uncharacterized protein (DUF433 family)
VVDAVNRGLPEDRASSAVEGVQSAWLERPARSHDRGGVDYRQLITVEPAKREGKPGIRNARITVCGVRDYLPAGMTHHQTVQNFAYSTEEDIRACLAFAADHGVLAR